MVVSSAVMSMSVTAGTADGFCTHAVQLAEDHGRTETLSSAGRTASCLTVPSPPRAADAVSSPAQREARQAGVTALLCK